MASLFLLLVGVSATFANQITITGEESSSGVSGMCNLPASHVSGANDAWITAKGSFTGVCTDCDISSKCILDCKSCETVDVLGVASHKGATYDLTTGCHDIGFRAGKLLCAHVLSGKGIGVTSTTNGTFVYSKESTDAPSVDAHTSKVVKKAGGYSKRFMIFMLVIVLVCILGCVLYNRKQGAAAAPAAATTATATKNEQATPTKPWFTPGKDKWAAPKDNSLWSKQTGSML